MPTHAPGWRLADSDDVRAILTYHSLDDSGSPISVDPAVWRDQVAWLATGPVPVVSLAELVDRASSVDAIALTFDDGFANFATEALPVLQQHGLHATVFVPSDHVGGTNAWGGASERGIPELPLMDWPDLVRAEEAGMTVGGHSRTHPRLTTIPDAAVVDQVQGGAERLARELGQRPTTFAYPYGDYNDAVVSAVAGSFECACTTELAPLERDVSPLLLPRIDMFYFRERGQLQAWGTPWFRRRLWSRRQARRVRRVMTGGTG